MQEFTAVNNNEQGLETTRNAYFRLEEEKEKRARESRTKGAKKLGKKTRKSDQNYEIEVWEEE